MIPLSLSYELDPEAEESIRRVFLKGIGAVVVLLAMVVVVATLTRTRLGPTGATVSDAVAVALLYLTVITYSRAVAAKRLEVGREMRKQKRYDQVIAALIPFAGPGFFGRSRFDKTGEAHYLLAESAMHLGEQALLSYCKAFLIAFRRGEWAEKAVGLQVQSEIRNPKSKIP
jgi:hypothetical protein